MKANRIYIVLMIVALAAVAMLTVQEAIATTAVVSVNKAQNVLIPVTNSSKFADYYQRHPELRAPLDVAIDTTDYFRRHPELRVPAKSIDLDDYFMRH